MKLAMADAGINKEDVDYINAHGTGTELNDIAESEAIRDVFGTHAYKVPVSSTKGSLGHSLGATGAVEVLICTKVLNESVIPPTINLDNPDPRCDVAMDFVPNEAREKKVNIALSNSLGFGGHNACVIVGRI